MIRRALIYFLIAGVCLQMGCATQTKKIATGMLVGGLVGAGVGYEFVHHGEHKEFQTQNTIITAIVFALITGGVLAWHYREIEKTEVEISGRFARYRLCDPNELSPDLAKQLQLGDEKGAEYSVLPQQVGKTAISLDDNTKWAFPIFRKRFLQPERGENQVLSDRYIWEIIKPGSFVTRSQNPEYFLEVPDKTPSPSPQNSQEKK